MNTRSTRSMLTAGLRSLQAGMIPASLSRRWAGRLFMLFSMCLTGAAFASAAFAQEGKSPPASVITDQPDYAPGTTAGISGAGFQPGEIVILQVLHADGTPALGFDHEPWSVYANPLGVFQTSWHVCTDDCVGSWLEVTAVGQASGHSAATKFTDDVVHTGPGCGYVITETQGVAILPGTTDVGIHCDDCYGTIALPFPVTLYGNSFTSASVGSNGFLTFDSGSPIYYNSCLPIGYGGMRFNTIFAFWDDLYTAYSHQGIYTAVSGVAPNRTFVVEWRTDYCCGGGAIVPNFEIVFYEGQAAFDIVYGSLASGRDQGNSATIGVQVDETSADQYSCDTASLTSGLRLRFSPRLGLVATATASEILCYGGSSTVTVTACGGTEPYAGTGTFSRAAGTWSFTVTDANGGTAETSVTIGQPAAALASTATATNVSCMGLSDGAVSLTVSGGTPGYAYSWSNGAGTQNLSGLSAGSYTVTVTDANGCTATAGASVAAPVQADADGDGVADVCDICPNVPNSTQDQGAACIEVSSASATCLESRIDLLSTALVQGDVQVEAVTVTTVTFTKSDADPDDGSVADAISAQLTITRGCCGGVYNRGTDQIEWAVGTVAAPSSPFYSNFNQFLQVHFRFPVDVNLPGSNTVLHNITTGDYYDIRWNSWSRGGLGGFSYTRTGLATSVVASAPYTNSTLPPEIDISALASGEYQLCVSAVPVAPATIDMITFEVLNTNCYGTSSTYEFFLNGVSLGTTAGSPNNCTCDPPLQTFVVTDAGLLANWNATGGNSLSFTLSVSYYFYVAWVRVVVTAGGTTSTAYLFDQPGGVFGSLSLCEAGYRFSDSGLSGATSELSGVIEKDCVAFTKTAEERIVINGQCCTPPVVTADPASAVVCAGGAASLSAGASGSPAPSVQWQVSTGGSFSDLAGETGTALSFAAAASQSGNQYKAVFTNTCGSATSAAATLTVNTPPMVTADPASVMVCTGGAASFSAGAGGSPAPSVQWQVSTGGSFSDLAGETGTTLSFAAAASQSGNQYKAVFTNTCGSATSAAATLTINPAPVATITGPPSGSVYAVNTVRSFAGTWTDNTGDTQTAQWFFDGVLATDAVTITGNGTGSGTVTSDHTFTAAGVYMIKLKVTDNCGNAVTAEQVGGVDAMVVIYDPNAGFVTGGGWINSPPGAYVPDPTLTGRANFGFVSKYKKGATIPTGETEFQYKVGNLNFHSTSYDWLVVGGAKAQYKGTGTINSAGSYGFILTSIDGQISGGGEADKFRMKITTGGELVYDNMLNLPDSDDPTTVLGGGSIVIHTGGKSVTATAGGPRGEGSGAVSVSASIPVEFGLSQNYPNPFDRSTLIDFSLPERSRVSLVVYDLVGREVRTLADGEWGPGRHSATVTKASSNGSTLGAGIYFVRMNAQSLASGRSFTSLRKIVLVK